MRLSRALREKRPQYAQRHEKVILQHDNARPHVAKPVKTYLETLKWESYPTRHIPQILIIKFYSHQKQRELSCAPNTFNITFHISHPQRIIFQFRKIKSM